MVYQWKPGTPKMFASFDASEVGDELNKLAQRNKGRMNAQVVIAAARDVKSPLHKLFLWDDTQAAMMYRKVQARTIVKCVVLIRSDRPEGYAEGKSLFSTVSVHHSNGQKHPGYVTTNQTRKSPEYRVQVVEKAMRELRDWYDRYWDLPELAAIVEVLESNWPRAAKELPEKKSVGKVAAS